MCGLHKGKPFFLPNCQSGIANIMMKEFNSFGLLQRSVWVGYPSILIQNSSISHSSSFSPVVSQPPTRNKARFISGPVWDIVGTWLRFRHWMDKGTVGGKWGKRERGGRLRTSVLKIYPNVNSVRKQLALLKVLWQCIFKNLKNVHIF